MQKQIFQFMGRRIELWAHPDPDHLGRTIREWLPDVVVEAGDAKAFRAVAEVLPAFGYVPRGRYAATPTYVFSARDQERRMRNLLAAS